MPISGAPIDTMTNHKVEEAAPATPVGPPTQAARPETPSGVDARALHRSARSRSTISRSVDLTPFSPQLEIQIAQSGRNSTAPNFDISLPDPELDTRSSGSSCLVPQPPSAGSPALVGSSPRMRSVSSRAIQLPIRASLSVENQVPQGATDGADGPELCLSLSPKLAAAACPLTPEVAPSATAPTGASKAGRRSAALSQPPAQAPASSAALPASASSAETPAASADRRAPPGGCAGAGAAAAPAAAAAASAATDSETDPWVALRAHCKAAYGSSPSSDDEENGGGGGGVGPRRLMLMRHPSLPVTRSLSRSFGDVAVGAGPGPSVGHRPGQRLSPRGTGDTAAASTTAAEATAVATVVAMGPAVSDPAKLTPAAGRFTVAGTNPGVSTPAAGVPARSPAPTAAAASTAAATPRAAAAPATQRPGAATAGSGATPDLSGAALSRARLAAAATLQLQPRPQSPLPGSAALGPVLRTPSPTQSPTAAAGLAGTAAAALHRSESGTASTSSAGAAVILDTPPRGRHGTGASGGGASGAEVAAGSDGSPFASASACVAALAGLSHPAESLAPSPSRPSLQRQQAVRGVSRGHAGVSPGAVPAADDGEGLLRPPKVVSAPPSLEVQLLQQQQSTLSPLQPGSSGSGSTGSGGGGNVSGVGAPTDRGVSENGGAAVGPGSILDVAHLNTDPVHKRRLSADGLNRHARRFGASAAAAARCSGGDSSDGAATEGLAAAAVDVPAPGAAAAGGGSGATPTATSPSGAAGSSSSPSGLSGRAPLITALAFERAPWSQPTGGAHPAAAVNSPGALLAHGGAAAGPGLAASAKPLRPPHSPAAVRMPGSLSPGAAVSPRPQLALGVCSPSDRRGSDAGVAAGVGVGNGFSGSFAAAATAVDKLRGYKSSKVLLGSRVAPPSPASAPPPPPAGGIGAVAREAGEVASSSPGAATGLSPPGAGPASQRRTLGHFVSMRSLRTSTTTASFLERLSSSSLVGSAGPSRISNRRTIGGGSGAGAADWAPEGNRSYTFRRRDGSYSLDGSGCEVSGSGSGPWPDGGLADVGSGGAGVTAVSTGGHPESSSAAAGASGAAAAAAAAAGLLGRRSVKQMLPRGPNGLPLAWSAIEEDGREGSDGGREEAEGGAGGGGGGEGGGGLAGGAKWRRTAARPKGEEEKVEEEKEVEEEEEEGFNLARAGSWIDLHQTC
ncbi:hypothetical protein PLESTB_000550800 [Pleodorina starrii]|uniref:Uncharacterized protein n=1 Tax=Pleodorina starrii TaxID=330485 RepID=A0A9W6F0Z0_9CHLO|nr:hypothetical protein PLESTM_000275800 [Pleodorina starrii]GLC51810.1 hypothetical protein PLESTB_000550800 [Pleodorina starrii]GLC69523.1 hypothetical protein PLESTF_000841400 [Pleodorina starrii]